MAKEVGKIKGDKKLIVFSLETENLVKNAKEKLKSKNADMVVANLTNDNNTPFNNDNNTVTIITKNKSTSLPLLPKAEVADHILDYIGGL
ncbi:MAG: hypothetical protein FWE13_01405 [Firmicutes bacterium]|nr:hypothetical protein [Bacillota bacterium]